MNIYNIQWRLIGIIIDQETDTISKKLYSHLCGPTHQKLLRPTSKILLFLSGIHAQKCRLSYQYELMLSRVQHNSVLQGHPSSAMHSPAAVRYSQGRRLADSQEDQQTPWQQWCETDGQTGPGGFGQEVVSAGRPVLYKWWGRGRAAQPRPASPCLLWRLLTVDPAEEWHDSTKDRRSP